MSNYWVVALMPEWTSSGGGLNSVVSKGESYEQAALARVGRVMAWIPDGSVFIVVHCDTGAAKQVRIDKVHTPKYSATVVT